MKVKHYVKRAIIVDIMEFETNNDDGSCMDEIVAWINTDKHVASHDNTDIYIETLEGRMKATQGDYIIKGVRGEFYPCKPDIFKETYEELSQEQLKEIAP